MPNSGDEYNLGTNNQKGSIKKLQYDKCINYGKKKPDRDIRDMSPEN